MTPYDREDWGRFHRDLGRCNLHVQGAEQQRNGTWVAPIYTVIGPPYYRQRVGTGTGLTLASAIAHGLSAIDSPLWRGTLDLSTRMALVALLLEDSACAR